MSSNMFNVVRLNGWGADFIVEWDYKNKEIDEIMSDEISLFSSNKKMLWFKENIKEMTGLKETIYISTKQNCDGCFYVYLETNNLNTYDFKLEDGCVYMNDYKSIDPQLINWIKI